MRAVTKARFLTEVRLFEDEIKEWVLFYWMCRREVVCFRDTIISLPYYSLDMYGHVRVYDLLTVGYTPCILHLPILRDWRPQIAI